MKKLIAAVVLCSVAGFASAATCEAQADEKKLAGAARNSFVKKCTTDAKGTCEMQATEKKLNGAAKNSFVNRCIADTAGAR